MPFLDFLYHVKKLLAMVTAPEFSRGATYFLNEIDEDQKIILVHSDLKVSLAMHAAAKDLVP